MKRDFGSFTYFHKYAFFEHIYLTCIMARPKVTNGINCPRFRFNQARGS